MNDFWILILKPILIGTALIGSMALAVLVLGTLIKISPWIVFGPGVVCLVWAVGVTFSELT